MFKTALRTIAQRWKQPKCASTDERMYKTVYTYHGLFSFKMEIPTHATTRTNSEDCYELNVCIPIICCNPNLQCGIGRWGLWKVIRSWGWSLHEMRLVPLQNWPQRVLSSLLPSEGTDKNQKQALIRHRIHQGLILGFLELWELLFKPPSLR